MQGDPLLWRNINIVHPFCTNITNHILINLTNTAQGHLHSPSLFHCSKLTDAGLKLKGKPQLQICNSSNIKQTCVGVFRETDENDECGRKGQSPWLHQLD
ncbi:hypothetical protein RDI58_028581 [Solanum bulbocastanum]|uniref:Uncharacterized protein n=1 Tax=Solanum bulbocastanum TaxID=147425 RepID=A0AAN8SQI0_SOLBU